MKTIGSNLPVVIPALKESVQKFAKIIEDLRERLDNITQIEQFHNLYTKYVIHLLQAGSGHRPIDDMFCYGQDFELDYGFVIINDKESSIGHKSRLCWLSETEILQIKKYGQHLKALSIKMAAGHLSPIYGMEQAAPIKYLAEILDLNGGRCRSKNTHALFFYLNDGKFVQITKKKIEETLTEHWPYPSNQNRHLLESILTEKGVPGWMIDAHLGHIPTNAHAYGKNSVVSPLHTSEKLKAWIAEVIAEQGWIPLDGIRSSPRTKPRIKKMKIKSPWVLGPIQREIDRNKNKSENIHLAGSLVKGFFAERADPKKAVEESEITQLNRVVMEKYGENVEDTKEILEHVNAELFKHEKNKKTNLKVRWILGCEPSPFVDPWLDTFKDANRLRMTLAQYFDDQGRTMNRPILARQWAELMVSAALCGGLCDTRWLEKLAGPDKPIITRLGYLIYMEFGHIVELEHLGTKKYQLDWRWFPDHISLAILHRMGKRVQESVSCVDIQRELYALGKELGCDLSGNIKAQCKKLSTYACAIWKMVLPGMLYQVASGKQASFVLDSSTLARVAEQRPVLKLKSEINKPTMIYSDYFPKNSSAVKNEATISCIDNKQFKRKLASWFPKKGSRNNSISIDDEEIDDNATEISEKTKRKYSKNPKREIAEQIEAYVFGIKREKLLALKKEAKKRSVSFNVCLEGHGIVRPKISDLSLLIAFWCIKMCRHGSKSDKSHKGNENLALSTIQNYTYTVFNALKAVSDDEDDLIHFSSEEWECLYIDAIKFNKAEDRGFLLDRLRSFHDFLESKVEIDSVEWPVICGTFQLPHLDHVNASLITVSEYEHALNLVEQLSEKDSFISMFVGASIVLGYRFGLRIGEVYRLRKGDLQRGSKGQIYIQIQNTRLGKTKTFAGVRTVPLLGGDLSPLEKKYIVGLEARLKLIAKANPSTPFVAHLSDMNASAISYNELSTLSDKILKLATRNDSITFHVLRHTWMNRIFLASFGEIKSHPVLKNLQQQILYQKNHDVGTSENEIKLQTERVSFGNSLYELIGHQSLAITLNSYIHVCDWMIADLVDQFHLKGLTLRAASYLRAAKPESLIHQKSQNNIEGDANEILRSYKSIDVGEIPEIVFTTFIDDIGHSLPTPEKNPIGITVINDLLISYAKSKRNPLVMEKATNLYKEDIANILAKSEIIEGKSEYVRFSVRDPVKHLLAKDAQPDEAMFSSDKTRLSRLMDDIDQRLEKLNDDELQKLRKGTNVWMGGHRNSKKEDYILLETHDDLNGILYLLNWMGFEDNRFEIRYPVDMSHEVLNSLKHYWSNSRLTRLVKSDRSSSFLKSKMTDRTCVALAFKAKEKAFYTTESPDINVQSKHLTSIDLKTLNRLLFLLAVKLSI